MVSRHLPRYAPGNSSGSGAPASDGRLFSPSFERNFEPIRDVLADRLEAGETVLEIGAGTGQHAAHLARAFPGLRWIATDPNPGHLRSIAAWRRAVGPETMAEPFKLDATGDWPALPGVDGAGITTVFSLNVIHIAPWTVAEGIVRGTGRVLGRGGKLIFYGPFRIDGGHTGPGNRAFDAALRADDPAWGVRDVAEVAALASAQGLGAPELVEMPSDNRIVVFTRAG